MAKTMTAVRGSFFDFIDDPWKHVGHEEKAARFYSDGLLVIEDGKVKAFGPYDKLSAEYKDVKVTHIKERLILPGFIDGHIHMAQTRVLGAYGEQLLGWLQQWIFPEEKKYNKPDYAKEGATHFFDALLAGGTTTCQSFLTSSTVSVEAYFDEASKRNLRVIGGLTGMDRFGPPENMDSADNFYKDSKKMIEKYHRKGRNLYAITPRFPLGSSHDLMAACGKLKKEFPDVWVNTHLNENPTEIRGTNEYHEVHDYLGSLEKYGLVGPKFTGGHSVWTSNDEYRRLHKLGGAVCFCPLSNLFLGSGLFRLGRVTDPDCRIKFSLGCDMGAGNRFSIINVLDEAYKVGMCNNTLLDGSVDPKLADAAEAERNKLSPYRGFYSATLGGAEALCLEDVLGNFDPGKEADFVVLDWNAGQMAMPWHESLLTGSEGPQTMDAAASVLFSIMTLGDDRNIDETWIMGERAYSKSGKEALVAAR
ncbi:MAG TPA: guanine deaminase [Oculatellaceae cyanobacterium]